MSVVNTDDVTPISEVAAAASDRTVLCGHTTDTIYLVAHSAPWRIYCTDILGWTARRVDRDRRDMPEATGWLGDTTLSPAQVVENLLGLPELATTGDTQMRWLPTGHPWSPSDTGWYARCPYPMAYRDIATGGCGATGAITPTEIPTRPVDLDVSIPITCRLCGHTFDGRPQAVPATSSAECPRCKEQVPAPVEAVHHRCEACGWWFFDPTPTHHYTELLRRNTSTLHAGPAAGVDR